MTRPSVDMRASFALFSITDAMQADALPCCCCSSSCCACCAGVASVAVLAGRLDVAAGVQRPSPTVSAADACLLFVGEAILTAGGSEITLSGCTAR